MELPNFFINELEKPHALFALGLFVFALILLTAAHLLEEGKNRGEE